MLLPAPPAEVAWLATAPPPELVPSTTGGSASTGASLDACRAFSSSAFFRSPFFTHFFLPPTAVPLSAAEAERFRSISALRRSIFCGCVPVRRVAVREGRGC